MDPRPYTQADHPHCLEICDPTERKSFEEYLATNPPTFYVLEHNQQILGCGGYSLSDRGTQANLAWGMIRRDLRGQGLGRFLLMYRLREIAKANTVQTVRVSTSPNTAPFFEKQGFKIASIQEDRIELIKKLTVCP
jgi:N-acetylglutamate synthase-like GNAT family acetyltransferase